MGLKIWILGILFVDLWVCYFDLGFGVWLNGCLQIWCMWFGFKSWWVTFQICGGRVAGCYTVVFLFCFFPFCCSSGLEVEAAVGCYCTGLEVVAAVVGCCTVVFLFFLLLLHWVRGGGSHGL